VGAPDAPDDLYVLADTNLARILEQARTVAPRVVIIDSIQMIYRADLDASPGSVAQLRRCCTDLVYLAKSANVAVLLVGHVTKDGALAGPKLIEHMVDAVLSFEGDRHHAHRVVRAVKNRFGATLEVGIFEMRSGGLREAPDAASIAAKRAQPRPGSVVCPVLTGSRTVLVELQALTATGFPGAVKRKASGLDGNRLAMLIAVLEQHAGLRLADRDVFTSAVGGIRVTEPAADLAVALAIAGSHLKRSLPHATAVLGEVGLGGEIRPVAQCEQRVREAARLGYTRLLVPPASGLSKGDLPAGVEHVAIPDIGRAVQELT
jgi:DNA repair protein RadA/Sms